MDATQVIEDSFWAQEEEEEKEEGDEEKKREPLAKLRILKNEHIPESELPLYLGENVLGRDDTSCSLPLPVRSVSKQHAVISVQSFRDACGVAVETLLWDLGSMNGTRKGRVRLTPHVRYALGDGDSLLLADLPCQYVAVDTTRTERTPAEGGAEKCESKETGKLKSPPEFRGGPEAGGQPNGGRGAGGGRRDQDGNAGEAAPKYLLEKQTPTQQQTLVHASDSESDSEGERGGERRREKKGRLGVSSSPGMSSPPVSSTFVTPFRAVVPESGDESSITPSSSGMDRMRQKESSSETGSSTGPGVRTRPDPIDFHMDSDTDAESEDEPVRTSPATVPEPKQNGSEPPRTTAADPQAHFHMDSDTDVEEDAGTDVSKATEASDHARSVRGAVPCPDLRMDSDTDAEEDDGTQVVCPPPGSASSAGGGGGGGDAKPRDELRVYSDTDGEEEDEEQKRERETHARQTSETPQCSTPRGQGVCEDETETQAILSPSPQFRRPALPPSFHLSICESTQETEELVVAATQSFVSDGNHSITPSLCAEVPESPGVLGKSNDSPGNSGTEEDWALEATQAYGAAGAGPGGSRATPGGAGLEIEPTQAYSEGDEEFLTHSHMSTAETQLLNNSAVQKEEEDGEMAVSERGRAAMEEEEEEATQEIEPFSDTHLSTAETQIIVRNEEEEGEHHRDDEDLKGDETAAAHPPRQGRREDEDEDEMGQRAEASANSHLSAAETQPLSSALDGRDEQNAKPSSSSSSPSSPRRRTGPRHGKTRPQEEETPLSAAETQPVSTGADDNQEEETPLSAAETQPVSTGADDNQEEETPLSAAETQPVSTGADDNQEEETPLSAAETQPVSTGAEDNQEEEEQDEDARQQGRTRRGRREAEKAGPGRVRTRNTKERGKKGGTREEEAESQSERKGKATPVKKGGRRRRGQVQSEEEESEEEEVSRRRTMRGRKSVKEEGERERVEEEKEEGESMQRERREKEEKEREEKERKEQEEKERMEQENREREEKERLEQERKENEERERLEKEKKERLEKEKREREEKERLEKEKRERDEKEKREREEKERLEKEKREREEKERLEKEEREREEKERLEKDKRERDEKEKREREEKERLEKEKREREEKERLEKEKRERDEKEKREREETERLEKEKREREEKERLEKEKREREEKERLEKEKREREERERLEKEKREREEKEKKERLEKEKREREEKEKREREVKEKTSEQNQTKQRTTRGRRTNTRRTATAAYGGVEGLVVTGLHGNEDSDDVPAKRTRSRSNSSSSVSSERSTSSTGRGRGRGRGQQTPEPSPKPGRGRRSTRAKATAAPPGGEEESEQDRPSQTNKETQKRGRGGGRKSVRVKEEPEEPPAPKRGRKTVATGGVSMTTAEGPERPQETSAKVEPKGVETRDGERDKRGGERKTGEGEELDESEEIRFKIPEGKAQARGGGGRRGRRGEVETEVTEEKGQRARGRPSAAAQRRKDPKEQTEREREDTASSTVLQDSERSCGSRKRAASVDLSPAQRTPRRTVSSLTVKVLFTGVVDEEGEGLVGRLGGCKAKDVYDMTHLVTDKVRRTVKFLCAVARGVPVVTTKWLEKCGESECFLPPEGFLVKDSEQEKKFKFSLQEALQTARTQPLLRGYEIHVTRSVKPEPSQMKDIIVCSGARYLPKMPSVHKAQTVVVSCVEDAGLCAQAVSLSLPVVSAEFLLIGILQQKVDLVSHALTGPAFQPGSTKATARGRKKT
ncbi:mediator of DNA damage checkpoint protein 1 [Chanos chanos]|uniref:Mediator of DNA damage checkpoint protein 1 n=1 Tax=Chanos chanos TaxID=29144 RepID=A0A6J2WAQ3_CHACN|nr:mediator of DNA damage checkpoint protein 1 [Chanos chanos]